MASIKCGHCKELHGSVASVKDCGDYLNMRGIYAKESQRDYWEAKAEADREYAEYEMIRAFETDGFL